MAEIGREEGTEGTMREKWKDEGWVSDLSDVDHRHGLNQVW